MTELLLILLYITIGAALCATLWSVCRTIRIVGKTSGISNGINLRRICVTVRVGMLLLLVLSFALAGTDPIKTASQQFTDIFWLRTSNMLVFTGTVAIVLATCATLFCFLLNMKSDGKISK